MWTKPNSDSIANLQVECHEFCCYSSFSLARPWICTLTCITTPILTTRRNHSSDEVKWWSSNCKFELTKLLISFYRQWNDSNLNCMILSLLGLTLFLTLITMHGHWKRKLGSRSEPTHRICDKVSMVAPPSWPGENPITLKLSATESTVVDFQK